LDLPIGTLLDALGLAPEQHLDTFIAHNLGHRLGHVDVFVGQKLWAALHNGNLAAEAPEHLGEF
jgi:hypothetical protein